MLPIAVMPDRWVESLARVGFAVKGILYLLLGSLALAFGLRVGGRITDLQGGIAWLLGAPGGRLLVGIVACGLALYAAWRLMEAFADANRRGRTPRGLAARARYALSGAVYGVLAYDAARLAFMRVGSDGLSTLPSTISGSLLAQWVAMIIAVGVGAYGVMQIRRALSGSLSDQLRLSRVERGAGHWAVRVSRAGIGGRAVVLLTMAVLLFRRATESVAAAATTDAADSMRLAAALPNGRWILAGIGAGLMAYGVFQLIQARYRNITAP